METTDKPCAKCEALEARVAALEEWSVAVKLIGPAMDRVMFDATQAQLAALINILDTLSARVDALTVAVSSH